ncbi:atypical chemokine receptor 2-like [Polypterus senegalus]|nr:atypical chemokine receptor 2-like [Polypterus senegalus]
MASPPTETPEGYTDYYLDDLESFVACEKADVRAFAQTFLPIFYGALCVSAFAGNGLLVFVCARRPMASADLYLLNLVISDLLFASTLPFWAAYVRLDWMFGDGGCKALTAMYNVNFYSSVFFISCMGLDRYLEISYRGFRGGTGAVAVCAVVWTVSLLASTPDWAFAKLQVQSGRRICLHDYGTEQTALWRILLRSRINVLGFVLPLLLMVGFYCRLYCLVGTRGARAFRLVLALLLAFFLLWCPYNVVLVLLTLQDLHVFLHCDTSRRLDFALQLTESLAFVHVCLNPLLYAVVTKTFRRSLGHIVKSVLGRRDERSLEVTCASPSTLHDEVAQEREDTV